MDTEKDLQPLQQQIEEMRKVNIAIYNELTRQNKNLSDEILNLRNENNSLRQDMARYHKNLALVLDFLGGTNIHDHLNKYLKRVAAMQSAEFIIDKMPKVKSFDGIDPSAVKCDYLQYVFKQFELLPDGMCLEFGVYKGNSINFISSMFPDKIIYGFDSFEGLPENWRYDGQKGFFDLNGILPKVNKNVRLIKGWFNETLPRFVKDHSEKCAFIHVDSDLYSSAKTIFAELKNQIVPGTIIAFDEYFNYPGWQEGEHRAFMELVKENNFDFEYIARTAYEQVAVVIK